MKKVLIAFVLIVYSSFSSVIDNDNIYNLKDKEKLDSQIVNIKKSTGVDVDVITSQNSSNEIFEVMNTNKKKIIIFIQKNHKEKVNVKIAFSNDINLVGYEQFVDDKLEELKKIISSLTYTDYTFELLKGLEEILVRIDYDTKMIEKR
ncbi:MAG: hypothetical protein JW924_15550 [Fusobacteriaceae bacterium]|nr:hypothetical protein [Fusobacteriaceae bacterium]